MVKNNTGIADFFVFDTKNSIFVKRYCVMSTKGRLKDRFCSLPNDFTFEELVRLFSVLGFELDNKGNHLEVVWPLPKETKRLRCTNLIRATSLKGNFEVYQRLSCR